jgi:hypothetical protein
MEVCPLSRGMMLSILDGRNPYPPHYRTAFAFSILLYPQHLRVALRLPTSVEECYGLTVFVLSNMDGLGRSLFAGGLNVHDRGVDNPCASHTPFWFEPVSIFGSLVRNDVYREFACARHTTLS